eukprot:c4713_g1_i1.p1 GENE.c4713_g1_i1~~c4713_g1_i1.p1  ORF type:complete len:370 (+),score=73.43 c4713_g1_i1:52-1110(+)
MSRARTQHEYVARVISLPNHQSHQPLDPLSPTIKPKSGPPRRHKPPLAFAEPDATVTELERPNEINCPPDSRASNIAVFGVANAGKSTLVNAMVGGKVAAVSHKYHTTRKAVLGILTLDKTQLVFCDTPGIVDERAPHRKYYKSLCETAWETTSKADQALLVIDAVKNFDVHIEYILSQLAAQKLSPYVALNKMDLVKTSSDNRELESLRKHVESFIQPRKFFHVSALTGSGLPELKECLLESAPLAKWQYPHEWVTDQSLLQRCEEIIREKIFQLMHKEIPYAVTQKNMGWTQLASGDVRIDQVLLVPTPGHKRLIQQNARTIIFKALPELQKLLDRKVHLFLSFKVVADA